MEQNDSIDAWEQKKLQQEFELRSQELELEQNKQVLEQRRMWMVGIAVPLSLAIVSSIPTAINSFQNMRLAEIQETSKQKMEQNNYERELVANTLTELGPTVDAALRLRAYLEAGLIDKTNKNLQRTLDVFITADCTTEIYRTDPQECLVLVGDYRP